MNMELGMSDWRTYEQGIRKEWLLTNGIGGFASSTVIGSNTRRYHGLLVASFKPPVQRHLILSKVDETVYVDGKTFNLYSFATPDYIMKGYHHLQRFLLDPLPTFIYNIGDTFIEKTVCMVYGENTVILLYHIINGRGSLKLRLTPLVNFRDYHHNSSRHHMRFTQKPDKNGTRIKPYDLDIDINLFCPGECFTPLNQCWFENMEYAVERERGLSSTEDHYIPGFFDVQVDGWEEKYVTFTATVERDAQYTDGLSVIKREKDRLDSLTETAGYRDEFASSLVQAADNFIVYRKSTGARTIIAGYPWFTDWGRDTMISLSGLTLATKRFEDAEQILLTFSKHVKDGLVPNMFPDEGQEPAYNSVDAALWYFEAVGKYTAYTGKYEFVKSELYASLKEIIQAFINGTRFNIKMDSDCLVYAGDQGTQLTWMDAKVGSYVVTPRQGKAVEVNALWYNALMLLSKLAARFGEDGGPYAEIAGKAKESFIRTFWNEEEKCLFDVVNGDFKDGSVRPNQIMAISLSYPLLGGEAARAVVEKVWQELYTTYGLRSLSPKSEQYRGIYIGDQTARDSAYHQGTVWVWPMGHFVTAFVRTFGKSGKYGKIAAAFLAPFKDHLKDAGVGSISELFDGDEPLTPRGCIAQAWSVGEILRAYTEDLDTGNKG